MKIIFAGSPKFSLPSFEQLVASNHTLCAAYTQPDRPSGRGRKTTPTVIKTAAAANNIAVYCPTSLKDEQQAQQLQDMQPDIMVVVAYGLLLPQQILDIPRLGCINIHPSLLPQWRGAAPIQHSLLAGDTSTGVTIMQMELGMDSGPILMQQTTPIKPDETSGELHDRLAELGAKCLLQTLEQLEADTITAQQQDETLATYTKKISKQDALIDWQQPAITIANQIRAYNPWPVAHTQAHNNSLRIWNAAVLDEQSNAPAGQVIACSKDGIDVNTGQGVLRLLQLQMPGKRPLPIDAFFNAHQQQFIPHDTQLG